MRCEKAVIVCVHSNGIPVEKYDPTDNTQIPLMSCTSGGMLQTHDQTVVHSFRQHIVAIKVPDPMKPTECTVTITYLDQHSSELPKSFSISAIPGQKQHVHEVREDGTIAECVRR
jgi:hypothetical protein